MRTLHELPRFRDRWSYLYLEMGRLDVDSDGLGFHQGEGVVPVPIDFLPLDSVDPGQYTDRPYWLYESKFIAGAAITAADQQLYGLALTNFGCGPNSFILCTLEDIMGGKPMGQLEIDEHAAEAGIVTRLEAFVDTIKGYSTSATQLEVARQDIYRGASPLISREKTLLIPRMAPHAEVVAAAMESCGYVKILFTNVYRCAGRNFCETSGSGGYDCQNNNKSE